MAGQASKNKDKSRSSNRIAENKKARFDYSIEDTFEAGLALEGWEVKSLRDGRALKADAGGGAPERDSALHGPGARRCTRRQRVHVQRRQLRVRGES